MGAPVTLVSSTGQEVTFSENGAFISDHSVNEDDPHTTGDALAAVAAVRRDTAAASGADGDYVTPITDATGHLWVNASVAVTPTDRSGTITTGATAQTLAASNTARKGFWIQNNSSGDLWINTLAAAIVGQPSMKIAPGAMYEAPFWGVPTGAISIIGATTGQAFSAREW